MKTVLTITFAAILSACASYSQPSDSEILERLAYIRTLDCQELVRKLNEYRALRDERIVDLTTKSVFMAQDEMNSKKCKR